MASILDNAYSSGLCSGIMSDLPKPPPGFSDYMSKLGAKGGKKEGPTKKRGDSDYYKAIRAKVGKKDATQAASVEGETKPDSIDVK